MACFREKPDHRWWVRDYGDLVEFLSYVMIYAPDEFPQEDEEGAMTIEQAFEELRHGLEVSAGEIGDPLKVVAYGNAVNESHRKFLHGDDVEGTRILQKLQQALLRA